MMKHWPILVTACIVAGLAGYLSYKLQPKSTPQALPDVVQLQHDLGGDFTLTRHDGVTVTNKNLQGEYLLMYFGYSYCPDICPTSLIQMVRAVHNLDKELQSKIRPVFITVDPDRDTVEEIAAYVADFDPRMIGLTGTQQQIDLITKLFKVYARKNGSEEEIADKSYLVDHSSFFYLIKPNGKFSHLFSSRITTETLSDNLSIIIKK